mgnify:CR=1 FL=1
MSVTNESKGCAIYLKYIKTISGESVRKNMFFQICLSFCIPLVFASCPYIVDKVCNSTKSEYGVGPNLVFMPHKNEDGWYFEFPVCNFGQMATGSFKFKYAAKILAWVEFACGEHTKLFEFHPIRSPGIHTLLKSRPYPSNDPYLVGPLTQKDIMQCDSNKSLIGRFVRCKTYDPINTNCSIQQFPRNITVLKESSTQWNCIETHANIPINYDLSSLDYAYTLKTYYSDVDTGRLVNPDILDGCCSANHIVFIVFVVILGMLVFRCVGLLVVGWLNDHNNKDSPKDSECEIYNNPETGCDAYHMPKSIRMLYNQTTYADTYNCQHG